MEGADDMLADQFDEEIESEVAKKPAYEHIKKAKGRELTWRSIGKKYWPLFEEAMRKEWGS